MRIATLAVAFLLTAACTKTVKVETAPTTGETAPTTVAPAPTTVPTTPTTGGTVLALSGAEDWNGTLKPMGGSAISGMMKGTTTKDTTHVTVTLTGGTPGATYPWHIHEGKCTDAGPPIFGDPSAYPPLVADSSGSASVTALLYTELHESKDYIINVHASPANLATIVACGDFDD